MIYFEKKKYRNPLFSIDWHEDWIKVHFDEVKMTIKNYLPDVK